MSEFVTNFHFLRPWYLLLLILPVIFGVKFFKNTQNKSSWENVIDKNLLDYLLVKGSSSLRAFVAYSVLIGFLFAIVAIAGPAWKQKDIPTLSPDNPVIVLLSLSSDMVEADVTPDRLARAKFKLSDLLKLVKGAQVGLIVYTNEPFLITPITSDLGLVANLLDQIDFGIMPIDGDRPDRAIDLASKRLKDSGYREANIVILAADGGERFDFSLKAAEASGFKISAINISKNEVEKLKLVADKTGGVFANISADDGDIERVAYLINSSVAKELKLTENMQSKFEDFGYYLLFIPLICCVYLFRRGILAIVFLLCATSAQAAFFLNDNQAGLKDFNAGNFEKAAAGFDDLKWRAAALYRAGKFDEAVAEYSKFDDVDSVYNQGNALAKGGKTEEAIEKYKAVLEADSKHEDARFNLEYLKQQQKKQEQNQSSGEEDSDSEQEKNQDQQSSEGEEGEGNQDQDNSEENGDQEQNNNDQNGKKDQQSGEEQSDDDEKNNKDGSNETIASPSNPRNEKMSNDGQRDENPEVMSMEETDQEPEDYSEALQAREQQFREIPEDVGGLLRAFILKEYRKGRYSE